MKIGRSSKIESAHGCAGIDLDTLKKAIKAAGGSAYTLESAEALLVKIKKVEASPGGSKLLVQLIKAKEPGDFRGRLLEVNVAAHFLERNIDLFYEVKQGMTGDIDLRFDVNGRPVYLELKHLGLDHQVSACMTHQIEQSGTYSIVQNNDLGDIVRLQRALISKASTKKFNPNPAVGVINLVAVDVTELQLGTVDYCDCLLAASGNGLVHQHCHPACLRPSVVGIFEPIDQKALSADQNRWISEVHQIPSGTPHPRSYIHGAVFLFRTPAETAALSYEVRAVLVWNENLVSIEMATPIEQKLHEVLP